MNNCFICKSKINKQDGNHLYRCANKNGVDMPKKELKFLNIKYNTSQDILFEKLYELYITLEFSILEISEHYRVTTTDSIFLLDYFNITRRNIKSANSTKRRSESFKETCLEKYGVDNPSKCIDIQHKKEETFLKNYGVSNIFSVKGMRDTFHNIMLAKYGTGSLTNKNGYNHSNWWDSLDITDKEKRLLKLHLGWTKFWNNLSTTEQNEIIKRRKDTLIYNMENGITTPFATVSNLETRINKVLQNNAISFIWQKWINRRSYDFHILDSNIILEINGDYWHANPNLYEETSLIQYPGIKKYAKEVWDSDKLKKELAESYGYKVLYIWESDINKLDDEQLSVLVMGMINENQKY